MDNVKDDAAKDKEFIIVKSKGGNYFYIVIDHGAEIGRASCRERV